MKPEAMKIAIAEACGWKHDVRDMPANKSWLWVRPDGETCHMCSWPNTMCLPDYLNDLNVMQAVVLSQNEDFQFKFACELFSEEHRLNKFLHQLTATDWARVFLKVKGLNP